jgi:DNA polymerase I-like protein with 3'-5' exonuclease and polymerase domains
MTTPQDLLNWEYNARDCVNTFEVDAGEQSFVDSLRVRAPHDFQQALFYPALKTMDRGIRVDKNRRAGFAAELLEEIATREQWLIDVLGKPVNIKSPLQMQELFYVDLGQKPRISRKTKTITTDDEALSDIATKQPLLRPIVKTIQELRSLGVFLSTFVNAPLGQDGRMRCSYNIAGTTTYRLSSSQDAFGSGLNLQNIPKGGGADGELKLPNIRSLFIPDPGNTFFDIDLSSAFYYCEPIAI